jgi:hypothetical protein
MTIQQTTRQKLHDYINVMPDYGLSIVEPILAHFADEPFFVDTNLTEDEKAIISVCPQSRLPCGQPLHISLLLYQKVAKMHNLKKSV